MKVIDAVEYPAPLMNINHKKKLIYFENPKACSTSIKTEFGRYKPEIPPGAEYGDWILVCGESKSPETYFKFGFCRNPITRLASAYNMLRTTGQPKGFPITSFRDFVFHVVRNEWIHTHWIKQVDFLPDDLDFTGRFENFKKDWKYIAKKFKFRSRLTVVKHGSTYNYKDLYKNNEDLYEIVAEYYHEDMKRFGYSLQLT